MTEVGTTIRCGPQIPLYDARYANNDIVCKVCENSSTLLVNKEAEIFAKVPLTYFSKSHLFGKEIGGEQIRKIK
jgi:hypothetical protein